MKKLIVIALVFLLAVSAVAAITVNNDAAVVLGGSSTVRSNSEHDDNDEEIKSVSFDASLSNVSGNVSAQFISSGRFDASELNMTVSVVGNRVRLTANVPEDLDAIDNSGNPNRELIGTLRVSDEAGSDDVEVRMQAENALVINDIKIVTDDDEFDCDPDENNDCDSDVEELDPSSSIKLVITVENQYDDETNLDFEDVDLTVDSDNGDVDFDDDSISFDIDTDTEEELTFEFELDDDLDDGDSATITIELEGIDQNGARHGATYDFDIEFQLPEGEVEISELAIEPDVVCVGDEATISFVIENRGSDRQDNVRFALESSRLDIDELYSGIDLRKSGDRDDTFEDSFTFDVRNNQAPGTYTVRATVYYEDEDNDDTSTFQDVSVVVDSCRPNVPVVVPNQTQPQNASNSTIIVNSGVSGSPIVATPVKTTTRVNMVAVLVVLLIALALIIVAMAVALARRR